MIHPHEAVTHKNERGASPVELPSRPSCLLVIVYLLSFIRCTETPKEVCFVEEKVSYEIEKSEINRQKMHLTVTNRRPQYLRKSQKEVKQEIAVQLYQIFKKYV